MLFKPEVDKKSSLASPAQCNCCRLCGADTLVTAARAAVGSAPTALNTQEHEPVGPVLEEVPQPALNMSSHSSSPSEVKEDLVKKLRKKNRKRSSRKSTDRPVYPLVKKTADRYLQRKTGSLSYRLSEHSLTRNHCKQPPRYQASPRQVCCRGATAARRSLIPRLRGWPKENKRANTRMTACCCFLWQYRFHQDMIHLA